MRRAAGLLLAGSLLAAACSGGADKPELPFELPSTPPSANGVTDDPPLEPKVLLSASDDLETQSGVSDRALSDSTTGAFVSGDTVVGFAIDDVSGYDLKSGKKIWTAPIDMQGGTVCRMSQPQGRVKYFTVVYGLGGRCSNVAIVAVADGAVKSTTDLTRRRMVDGVEQGGAVADHLVTYKDVDYVIDHQNAVYRVKGGAMKMLGHLRDEMYTEMSVSPQGGVLVARHYKTDPNAIDAYKLSSLEYLWTAEVADIFTEITDKDTLLRPIPANPLWVRATVGGFPGHVYVAQLDPKTGEVLGRADAAEGHGAGRSDDGKFNLVAADSYGEAGLALPGGDMLFPQVFGVARHSLAKPETGWWQRLEVLVYDGANPYSQETVWSALTDDGAYAVGTISDEKDAEVLAIETATGKVVARWPLPEKYSNGFQMRPSVTLFDGGVVLTRNFAEWRRGLPEDLPKGERYDIGVFTFPEPTRDKDS